MQQYTKKESIKKEGNMKKQASEFEREMEELQRDLERCNLLVKQWLEERSQENAWWWPMRKKFKWLVKVIMEKRRRQGEAALKR